MSYSEYEQKIKDLEEELLEKDKEIYNLKEKAERLENALSFYADKNNWCFTGMYDNLCDIKITTHEQALPSGWHDKFKSITNLDLEFHNEYMKYGGKLARQTLKELNKG
jgi:chromosome segregation ATPase